MCLLKLLRYFFDSSFRSPVLCPLLRHFFNGFLYFTHKVIVVVFRASWHWFPYDEYLLMSDILSSRLLHIEYAYFFPSFRSGNLLPVGGKLIPSGTADKCLLLGVYTCNHVLNLCHLILKLLIRTGDGVNH